MTQPARRGTRNPEIAAAIAANRPDPDLDVELALDAEEALEHEGDPTGFTDGAYGRYKVQHEFEFVPGHTTRITYEIGDAIADGEGEEDLTARLVITANQRLLAAADDFEARLEERRLERKNRRITVQPNDN